jgi:uncharacterized membrane protein YqjE
MMDSKPSGGLLKSLTILASSLVQIVHTRLELLSTDLEEDRDHLLSLIIFSLIALFFMMIGVIFLAILLVVFYWESHRLLILSMLAGGFLIAGLAAALYAVHKAKTKPRLFLASLIELLKDKQQLDHS